MTISLTRRTFLKASALVTGAAGAGALLPRSLTHLAGAAVKGSCRLGGNGSFITAEESRLGQIVSVQRVYKAWDEDLFTPDVVESANKGRQLVMSIFPSNKDGSGQKRWADIAAGKYDAALAGFASQLTSFGAGHKRKIGLCLNHEPENDRDSSPGGAHLGNETDYRNAAMHFFSYLSSHGVTNMLRTIILFGSTYGMGRADDYWPGNQYIDRVGADCYNWFGTENQPDSPWRTFQQAAQGMYDYAVSKGKAAWVCETATLEDPHDPTRKAQWITDMGSTLKTAMPRIKAVMWYEGGDNGWSLSAPPEGSTAALQAYKGLLSQTYFV